MWASRTNLRACDFHDFTKRILAMRGYRSLRSNRHMSADLTQEFDERMPRATSVASFLRALDRNSIIGW
jgi:hypothetical protein